MVAVVARGPLMRLLVLFWDLADGLAGCEGSAEGFEVATAPQSCSLSLSPGW